MVGLRAFHWAACIAFALSLSVLARTIYVEPNGNDGTAEADNPERPFQSLTNAFRSLKNGDRLEIGAGKYVITPGYPNTYYPLLDHAEMKLQNLTNVTVAGDGEVEIYGEGPGDFLMIENCRNVRIENLTFKGNRPPVLGTPPELYSTVLLRAHNDSLHFERCRFLGFGDHAIAHLYSTKTSVNLVVTNCYFADGGALEVSLLDVDGAAVGGTSSGSRIVNNVIERCLRGIEVEGIYHGTITNVLIEGNIITDCYNAGIMVFATCHTGFGKAENYSDVRIINNRISNMYPHPSKPPYITYGILCWGGVNMLISGNRVENARLGMGIDASSLQMSLKDVTVVSNVVQDVRFRGIQVYDITPTNSLQNVVVAGNTIRRVGDEGILASGRNIECKWNILEDTAWAGERASITLGAGSDNGWICDNVIRNSSLAFSDWGIWVRGARDTIIYGNTFEHVPGGAFRDDGIDTKILPKVQSLQRENLVLDFRVSGVPGIAHRLEVSHDFMNWRAVTNKTSPETASFEVGYVADPPRLTPAGTFFRIVADHNGP